MYRCLCVKYDVFECGRGHEMKCLLYLLCELIKKSEGCNFFLLLEK